MENLMSEKITTFGKSGEPSRSESPNEINARVGMKKLENRMSKKTTPFRNSGAPHRSSSPNEINAQGGEPKGLMIAAKNWKT